MIITAQEIRDEILGTSYPDGTVASASIWPHEDYVKRVAREASDEQLARVATEVGGYLSQIMALGVYATICSRVVLD